MGDRNNISKIEGFTLVEVMIASALLLLAGFALYGSMTSSSRMARLCKDYTAAQGIAFDTLWEQYNRPYSEFQDITTATNWSIATPEFSQFDHDGLVRIAVLPPTEDEDYWEIHSNVVWSNHYSSAITNGFRVRRYRTERF